MATSFIAPIRCGSCGCVVTQKPGSKAPKFCPPCRHSAQEAYKERAKSQSKARRN